MVEAESGSAELEAAGEAAELLEKRDCYSEQLWDWWPK
jgi:hypothetical protein